MTIQKLSEGAQYFSHFIRQILDAKLPIAHRKSKIQPAIKIKQAYLNRIIFILKQDLYLKNIGNECRKTNIPASVSIPWRPEGDNYRFDFSKRPFTEQRQTSHGLVTWPKHCINNRGWAGHFPIINIK